MHQPKVEIQDLMQCQKFEIQDPLDPILKQSIRIQDPQDPMQNHKFRIQDPQDPMQKQLRIQYPRGSRAKIKIAGSRTPQGFYKKKLGSKISLDPIDPKHLW